MGGAAGLVSAPYVWTRADFPRPRAWARRFEPAMLAEIADAVARAGDRGISFDRLTPDNFPLPLTAPLIAELADDLEAGCGFGALAGYPVDRHDREHCLMAFAGVAAHLGVPAPQSYAGDMVVDVLDKGLGYSEKVRGYNGNRLLPFHSDGAAIAALMCLGEAAEGGRNVVLSAGAAYNVLAAERPDALAVLRRGFRHHRRGEHGPNEPPLSPEPIPVFDFHDGLLHCIYDRNQSVWAEKLGERLSPEQWDALDALDAVLARPELHLDMHLQAGDMQFLNNFVILHSRSDYRDGPGRRRHLLRLWLNLPGGRWRGRTVSELYQRRNAGAGATA